MDLTLNEEQQLLKKTARAFFEKECPRSLVRQMDRDESGHDHGLWLKMAGLGWMSLAFQDSYGGSGGNFLDLTVLLEEMGRACLPGPYFSTVVLCGLTVLDAGSELQKKKVLPTIAAGESVLAFAITEPGARTEMSAIATRANMQGGRYVINGRKLFVNYAQAADWILCVARTSGRGKAEDAVTLFLLNAQETGIVRVPTRTLVLDKQSEVVFSDVVAPLETVVAEPGGGWRMLVRCLERAAVGKCADMVGSAGAALDMSVAYAKDRVQFGRPIGSFQTIQNYCAEMAIDVDASRLITYNAAWRISRGLPATMEVSLAKNWVNEACQRVTLLGHQIHGGIGFCNDHDMHLFHRRVRGDALSMGDTASHQKAVARQLLTEDTFFPEL